MGRRPTETEGGELRRGWTTGACATAATKAAYTALLVGRFPDPVEVTLPKGQQPAFALAVETLEDGRALAGVVKDAGDDPDVTHGALIQAAVTAGPPGSGVTFRAGVGVGTVTKPGLPIPPGEPAINPVPREMIRAAVAEVAAHFGGSGDVVVEISVPDGEALAEKTWNPRLGIVGGISILGTTGVVIPYSCAAWIHSIHRGIDVARATDAPHVAAATGNASEKAIASRYDLPATSFLDMGDFAGGLLKYLRAHPLPKLTMAGGFAKLSKLAAGHLDLHSGRSQVDLDRLADQLMSLGAAEDLVTEARGANTAGQVLEMATEAGLPLADRVAQEARQKALEVLDGAPVAVEMLVVDRGGRIVGEARDGAEDPS